MQQKRDARISQQKQAEINANMEDWEEEKD